MGMFSEDPWGNDTAADWFDETMEVSRLPDLVERSLERDAASDHEEIRAAAYVVIALGHPFVWPADRLNRHIALAADQLQRILDLDVYGTRPDFIMAIQAEIRTLRNRLSA